jgi:hypothetical protein
MVRFRTQREVSEYLWKNPNDRSLISRLIAKWKVKKISWGYEVESVANTTQLEEQNVVITTLQGKIKDLEKRLAEKEQECNKKCNTSVTDDGLLDHIALLYTYIENKNEFMNKVIQSYFDKFSWEYDWDWAKDKIYKIYQYNEDASEKEELEYIKSLIS